MSQNDLRQARELLESARRAGATDAAAIAEVAQVWVNVHTAESFGQFVNYYGAKR